MFPITTRTPSLNQSGEALKGHRHETGGDQDDGTALKRLRYIVPLHLLPEKAAQKAVRFSPPETCYLILASNPSRTLPPSALELMNLIRTGFYGLLPAAGP